MGLPRWISKCWQYCKLITIEPLCFLYIVGLAMGGPVISNIVYIKVCLDKYQDWHMCNHLTNETLYKEELHYVQNTSSNWSLYHSVGFVIPSFFMAFVLGARSDTTGRRLPMLVPCLGQILVCIIYLLLAVYIREWPLWISIIASAVNGLTGGIPVLLAGCFSYLADISSRDGITTRISIVEAALNLGGLLGPLISAGIIDSTPLWLPFIILSIIFVICAVYVIARVQKNSQVQQVAAKDKMAINSSSSSLVKNDSCNTFMRSSGFQDMIDTFNTLTKPREGRKRLFLILLIVALFASMFVFAGGSVLFIYVKGTPLFWTSSMYSFYEAVRSVASSFGLFVILPLLKKRYKVSDMNLLLLGCVGALGTALARAFAFQTWILYLTCAFGVLSFVFTAIRGSCSTLTPMTEQGKVFAVVACVESVGFLLANLTYTQVYDALLDVWPGLTFIIGGSPVIFAFIIAFYLRNKLHKEAKDDEETLVPNGSGLQELSDGFKVMAEELKVDPSSDTTTTTVNA